MHPIIPEISVFVWGLFGLVVVTGIMFFRSLRK